MEEKEVTKYRGMRDELSKIADAPQAQGPVGFSGIGTHVARIVKQRGGTYNMLMLGLRDSVTDNLTGQIMSLIDSNEAIKAKQLVYTAQFPSDMRDKLLGAIDKIRSQPGIPAHYRSMTLLSAFDPPQ